MNGALFILTETMKSLDLCMLNGAECVTTVYALEQSQLMAVSLQQHSQNSNTSNLPAPLSK